MNNNIKVSVEYDTPVTNAFDALMEQYHITKNLATETTAYFKPLADAAEEAKAAAIMEQIEVIADYVRQLHSLGGHHIHYYASARCSERDDFGFCFTVKVTINGTEATWRHARFTVDNVKRYPAAFNAEEDDEYNILANWGKWRVFEKLERHCLRHLREAIEEQKEAAEYERKRLENIVK